MVKVLITGRTSFIGRQFIRELLARDKYEVYSLERLPYKSHYHSEPSRVIVFEHDLRAEVPDWIVQRVKDTDYVVHLAADVSGVKSLADPGLSVTTNVVGTFNALELARKLPNLKKFVQVSTGEVVGSMPFPFFADEKAPLRPSNPYSASKAAAEALVNAYRVSFGVPGVIVRSMNVFGAGQSLDRFVPMVLNALRTGQVIKCHVGTDGRPGSRCWLPVGKLAGALARSISPRHDYQVGEIYHVVGPERTNREIIELLAGTLTINPAVDYVPAGPSHDLRYALRDTKLGYDFSGDLDDYLIRTARGA